MWRKICWCSECELREGEGVSSRSPSPTSYPVPLTLPFPNPPPSPRDTRKWTYFAVILPHTSPNVDPGRRETRTNIWGAGTTDVPNNHLQQLLLRSFGPAVLELIKPRPNGCNMLHVTLLDHVVATCWAGLAKRTQHCATWWPNARNMLHQHVASVWAGLNSVGPSRVALPAGTGWWTRWASTGTSAQCSPCPRCRRTGWTSGWPRVCTRYEFHRSPSQSRWQFPVNTVKHTPQLEHE